MTHKLDKLSTPTDKRTLIENDPDPIIGYDPDRSQPILGDPATLVFHSRWNAILKKIVERRRI